MSKTKTKPAAPAAPVTRAGSYAVADAGNFEPARALLRDAVKAAPSVGAVEKSLGLADRTLGQIVRPGSAKVPTIGTAQALAAWLGLSLDDLLAGTMTDRRAGRVWLGDVVAGDNPRKTFDEEGVAELAASIAAQGLLQPLVVRRRADGKAELIAGERRVRAIRSLDAATCARVFPRGAVPCIWQEADDTTAKTRALVENLQRRDLSNWELTRALGELAEATGGQAKALAGAVGMGERAVQMHVKCWRDLQAEDKAALRGDYEAGRIGFKELRETLAEKRPAAPEAAAPAEAAAPDALTLYQGHDWRAVATYQEQPGGDWHVVVTVEQGHAEVATASGTETATATAQAAALRGLYPDLGAALMAPDNAGEAEELAGLCLALANRAFADPETIELYAKAAADLREVAASFGAAAAPAAGEPGSPAEAEQPSRTPEADRQNWRGVEPGGATPEGAIRPTEEVELFTLPRRHLFLRINLAEWPDGWRAGADYRLDCHTPSQSSPKGEGGIYRPIKVDVPVWPTRALALAAVSAKLARWLRDRMDSDDITDLGRSTARQCLRALAGYLADADRPLAELPTAPPPADDEDDLDDLDADDDQGSDLDLDDAPAQPPLLPEVVANQALARGLREAASAVARAQTRVDELRKSARHAGREGIVLEASQALAEVFSAVNREVAAIEGLLRKAEGQGRAPAGTPLLDALEADAAGADEEGAL